MLTFKNLLKIRGIKDNTKDAKNLYILYKFSVQNAKYDNGRRLNMLKYIDINIDFNYIFTHEIKCTKYIFISGPNACKNYPKKLINSANVYDTYKIYKITAKNYKSYKLKNLNLFISNYEINTLFNY